MLRLTHSGWERFGDEGTDKRGQYDSGWPAVLAAFEAFAAADGRPAPAR